MAKEKTIYRCTACGGETPKWLGKCPDCSAWNTLVEERKVTATAPSVSNRYAGYAQRGELTRLKEVKRDEYKRIPSGSEELDRVLGGGIVPGSVLLIGGDPGIGKSTLLLQTVAHLATTAGVVYASGEESKEQIAMRAERLQVSHDDIQLLAESNLEIVIEIIEREKPGYVVIDSIQTMFSESLQSAPGSVTQIRECAAHLTRIAKTSGTTIFFVGHVTKDGQLAGPRVLEHIVDAVLYFEGDENANFRLLRTQKNRFGGANEVGVFAMTEDGLKDVKDPSSVFLGQDRTPVPGSCITVTQEGTRGLLVEIQALVETTKQPNPRRLGVGVDQHRLSMILAILGKSAGIHMYDADVFVTAVGGLKLMETGIDLAMALALVSSIKERALPEGFLALGELDLTGKVRPVHHVQERLREAEKMGFKCAIIPEGNMPKKPMKIKCIPVKNLMGALHEIQNGNCG
jgi:DNA repair protein RadA/Sms